LLARYTGKDFTGIWEFVDQNKGFKPEVDTFVATGWLKAPAYDKNRYWQTGYGMNMLPGLPQDNSANTNESPDWGKSFHMSRITGQSVRAFILTWPEWNAYYSDTSLAKAAFVGKKVNVLFFDGHVEAKRPDEIRPLFEVPLKRAQ
jgi:prepilin-type processing-associated H-X9-DG protein